MVAKSWIYEKIKNLIDVDIKLIEVVTHDIERVYYPFLPNVNDETYNIYRWNHFSCYKYNENDENKWNAIKDKCNSFDSLVNSAQNSVNQKTTLIFIENLSLSINGGGTQ